MAVPPVQTNTNTELGMQIFFPEFEVVKQGASFTLHVHTSNKSDGHFFNANQYDCFAHLYGPGGTHTFESGPMSDDSNGLEKN